MRGSQRQLKRRFAPLDGYGGWGRGNRAACGTRVALAGLLLVLSACHRPGLGDPSIAGIDSLMGSWSVESRDQVGTVYSGTLEVAQYDGHAYSGDLHMGFKGPDGADVAVAENAKLTFEGEQILVKCSKAVVLTENGEYNADNFLLTRASADVLKGLAKDSGSVTGTITLTRRHGTRP